MTSEDHSAERHRQGCSSMESTTACMCEGASVALPMALYKYVYDMIYDMI